MGAIISIFAIGIVFLCGALAGQPYWQPSNPAGAPVTTTPEAVAEGAEADASGAKAWQDALGALAADLRDALSAGAEASKNALQDLAVRAPEAIREAAQALQDSLPGALESAKETASELADNLQTAAADALETFGDWLGSLRGN